MDAGFDNKEFYEKIRGLRKNSLLNALNTLLLGFDDLDLDDKNITLKKAI